MSKQAVDVQHCKKENPSVYILDRFEEGMDYCDGLSEEWIWSIGENEKTGEIRAATDNRYYQKDGWKCLFLR